MKTDFMDTSPDKLMNIGQRDIDAFLGEAARLGLPINSLYVFQDGKVTFEDYWWPHTSDMLHTTHSATKSFTGTAVGFALAEGLLTLEDRVVEYFPEHVPAHPSDNLRAMTVRDLLVMRSGHEFGLSGGEWRLLTTSWLAEFMKAEVANPPGEKFIYSSANSHMLSAIVQRVSGQTVFDYLNSRFFAPLGVQELSWDADPQGITSGGNGLKLRTADFAKWGIVHLQNGHWHGRQVVPSDWIKTATRPHVQNIVASSFDGKRYRGEPGDGPVREGYGYQVWCGPESSYYASGMFGQKCLVLPKRNAVIAINAAIPAERHKCLLPAIFGALLNCDGERRAVLAEEECTSRAAAAAEPAPTDTSHDEWESLEGYWAVEPNPQGISELRISTTASEVSLVLIDRRGTNTLTAGRNRWRDGVSGISTAALHHSYQEQTAKVKAMASWLDPQAAQIECYFVETPFCDSICLTPQKQDQLSIDWSVNVNGGPTALPTYRAIRIKTALGHL